MPVRRLSVLAIIVCLAACSGATEPLGYVLPEPDESLDPAAVVAPTVLYACGYWNGDAPNDGKLFVDIFFGRRSEKDPEDSPRSESVAAVEARGGQIVHRFHFPAVRVWIESSAIPALSRDGVVNAVFAVSNLRRYDWSVIVGYANPNAYANGGGRIAELGGRVGPRFNSFNAISVVMPDASLNALRRDADVTFVSAGGIGCTD